MAEVGGTLLPSNGLNGAEFSASIEMRKLPDLPSYPDGSGREGSATGGSATSFDAITLAERDRLLLEHLPTVRYLARRIHARLPQHVDLDDLIAAGLVGLIEAFSKFDHGNKVQFRSYAQFTIRGAILDSLRAVDAPSFRKADGAAKRKVRNATRLTAAEVQVMDEVCTGNMIENLDKILF